MRLLNITSLDLTCLFFFFFFLRNILSFSQRLAVQIATLISLATLLRKGDLENIYFQATIISRDASFTHMYGKKEIHLFTSK